MNLNLTSRARAAFIAAVVIAPLVAGCGAADKPERASTSSPIKVGVPSNTNAINAHLAAKRYFDKAGLDVEFVDVTSGAAAIPMLLNGQLDIAQGDGIGTFAASANGVPIGIAGISTVQTDDPKLDPTGIFTADGSVKAADLSGRKFAVTQLGGAAELVAKAAIDAEGGNSSAIEFVELQAPQMAAAITAGRVAAGLITEPFASAAEKAGLSVLTRPQASGAPGLPAIYWVTSLSWGQQNRDLLNKFISAVQTAGRDANKDPELARATAAEFLEMKPEALAGIRLSVFADDATDTSKVSDFLNLANRYHVLAKQPDLDKLLSLEIKGAPQ